MLYDIGMRCALLLIVIYVGACSNQKQSVTDGGNSGPIWPEYFIFPAKDATPQNDQNELPPLDHAVFIADGIADGILNQSRDERSVNSGWQLVKAASIADLHDVACVAGHVWAVGNNGTILHHDPAATGGPTFIFQISPATTDLYAVHFADLSYGVAAGKGATIWETKDQGKTWAEAPQCGTYTFDTFYSFHLTSATRGFGVGLAIDTDGTTTGGGHKFYGGSSWICGANINRGEEFYDVFSKDNNAWIVGNTGGVVYYSSDEGTSWSALTTGTDRILRGIYLTKSINAVVVGEQGTILRSTNQALNQWEEVQSVVESDLYHLTFWDQGDSNSPGWAVGDNGTILYTKDAGQSWTLQKSEVKSRLEGVCFTSATEGWIVGAGGIILHTSTAGE